MNIKESIKRLGFTISKQNKPNSTDADALNTIIEFVNNTTKEEVNQNELFAKLYVMNFITQMRIVRDFDLAQKNVHKILKMSLTGLYTEFRREANVLEIKNYFENLGLNKNYGLVKESKDDEILTTTQQFNNKMQIAEKANQKEFLAVCDTWSETECESNLNAMITFALNEYKNK